MTLIKPSMFNANHTVLHIESLFLILEFVSKAGLWFPSLKSKAGILKKIAHPLFSTSSALVSCFSNLHTVLNLPLHKHVVQVVQVALIVGVGGS